MCGRSSTDADPPRRRPSRSTRHPTRDAIIAGLALLPGLVAGGCRPDPAEVREARAAAKEFSTALHRHDDARLRAMSACVIPTEGVRDARFRYLEPLRAIRVAALDSLIALYTEAHRLADSAYAAAPDSAADLEARFERARSLSRRAATTRAARRAADRSRPEKSPAIGAEVNSIRAHVLVRFAGEGVGPEPIDRDTIVRLVRAPGGEWIVFAFDLASDSPGPLPY